MNPHIKHTKRCLTILTSKNKLHENKEAIVFNVCTKLNRFVSVVVFKQLLSVTQYARYLQNKCVDCGKPIERRFASTLTCSTCEAKKIHPKFW